MLGIEKAKINKIKVVLKRPLVMWFSLNSSQLYQYMLMTFIQGGIPRRQNGLHPRKPPCWIRSNTPSRNWRSGIARKMGRGRMVQGVQTTDGGGRLPWTKRAGSATETLCRLPPERHDPAVSPVTATIDGTKARTNMASRASRPIASTDWRWWRRHREPVAEAGIRATGNGHPSGSRHHPIPTTTPAHQILRTTIPKTREDVVAREKTASKNC